MNENYANKLKEIIDKLDYKPRLLLHSCCAPCSSYVITYLYDYFDITILYYNPNIYPYEEYKKRKDEQIRLISNFKGVKIINCDYDNDIYNEVIKGLENEPECFYLRLNKTGEIAKKNDFEYFGTTLTVSPYKNARLLNEIGEDISKKYDIKWLYSDFKKNDGYKKSIELSKKYDLYRQDYCGCIYSKRDK